MGSASRQTSAAAATGTLGDKPISNVLVYARNNGLSGRLELIVGEDGRAGTVELWRGKISAARTTPPIAYFGSLAYELGMIDTPTHDATLLEIAKTKRLHGEVLIERGALTVAQRDQVLAEQACRKVHHMFGFPATTTFAFHEVPPSVVEPPLTLDPVAPVWRGIREAAPTEAVKKVLERLAPSALVLTDDAPLGRAGFTVDELAICDVLSMRPMKPMEIRAFANIPPARVDQLLYLLAITRWIESRAEPAAPPAPAPTAAPARRPSSPDLVAPSSAPGLRAVTESRPDMPAIRESQRGFPAVKPASTPEAPPPPSSRGRELGIPLAHTVSTTGMRAVGGAANETRPSMSFRIASDPRLSAVVAAEERTAARLVPIFGPSDVGPLGIEQRLQIAQRDDYFEALGVTEASSIEAVRSMYFRLAKVWHPNRLPPDLAGFRPEVEKIFAHMTQAHSTLTDPDMRKKWLAGRQGARR